MAYYERNRTFQTKLEELNPGFSDDFMGYRYQVLLWGDRNVIIDAQPLTPGLKSFSALLTTGEGYSSAMRICRSKQPSLVAPRYAQHESGLYICDANSEDTEL